MKAKFIQIHTLTAYAGVLLNRDESGMGKRLPYGGANRLRISSQCKKRHMRVADDPRSIAELGREIGQEGVRSRHIIEERVLAPLAGTIGDDVLKIIGDAMIGKLYGKGGIDKVSSRQALLLGHVEVEWLKSEVTAIAAASADPEDAKARADAWAKDQSKNLSELARNAAMSGSLEAALFGRMMASDKAANADAAVCVNHSYTVHDEQSELDYFSVVDDLATSAAGVFDQEINSGLFYGHMVVDVPQLVANTTGVKRVDWAGDVDRDLAARVAENLVHLVAKVTPGAKKGSTAPFSRASLVLIEIRDDQPATLDGAFLEPLPLTDRRNGVPLRERAAAAICQEIAGYREMYGDGVVRIQAAMPGFAVDGVERTTLDDLAGRVAAAIRSATA